MKRKIYDNKYGFIEKELTEEFVKNCQHNNVQFLGTYSLIGSYYCTDCGEIIDPQTYHKQHDLFYME
jgi:hypothetical protein